MNGLFRNSIIYAVLSFITLLSTSAVGQDLCSRLERLRASEDAERVAAFYDLIGGQTLHTGEAVIELLERHPGDREAIAIALIDLLELETGHLYVPERRSVVARTARYFHGLVQAVAALEDVRAIDVLITVSGSGRDARHGLVSLGEQALPGILNYVVAEHSENVNDVLRPLADIINKHHIHNSTSQYHTVTREHLLQVLQSESISTRVLAAEILLSFNHADIEHAMREVANSDPAEGETNGQTIYPVRDVAERWLEKHAGMERAVKCPPGGERPRATLESFFRDSEYARIREELGIEEVTPADVIIVSDLAVCEKLLSFPRNEAERRDLITIFRHAPTGVYLVLSSLRITTTEEYIEFSTTGRSGLVIYDSEFSEQARILLW